MQRQSPQVDSPGAVQEIILVSYGANSGFEYQVTKALPKLLELAGNQQLQFENDLAWVIEAQIMTAIDSLLADGNFTVA